MIENGARFKAEVLAQAQAKAAGAGEAGQAANGQEPKRRVRSLRLRLHHAERHGPPRPAAPK